MKYRGGSFLSRIATSCLLLLALGSIAQADTFTGSVSPGTPEAYTIPANSGDMLVMTVTPTSPTTAVTELELFEPIGDLVAIAQANVADGVSSTIDWHGVASGTYVLDVLNPGTSPYDYSLSISGNTGGSIGAPPAAVPEPSTIVLIASALFGLSGTLRRRLVG